MALALMLTACGGNDTPTGNSQSQAQNDSNQVATSAPEPHETPEQDNDNAGTSEEVPDEYYTFGDNVILWDTFDVTLGLQASFSVIELADHLIDARHFSELNGEHVVMIPISITNISDSSAGIFGPYSYIVTLPEYGRENVMRTHTLAALFGAENGIGWLGDPSSIDPDETVDRYIHLLYTSDGNYIIEMPYGVHFLFPVTKP